MWTPGCTSLHTVADAVTSFSTHKPTLACRTATLIVLLAIGACANGERGDLAGGSGPYYDVRGSGHPDGTGRYYMGREIAQVTGVDRQEWLERPQRETEELPSRVVQALELEADDVVADIGAGTGYFTLRIGPHVPDGLVLAVDIEAEALALIRQKVQRRSVDNVETVLGTVDDPHLPGDSVDVALIVFTYTQFSHPREMMVHIRESLVPGGRVVLVEYRGEDSTIPVAPVYTITEEQARRELEAAGLRWLETRDFLPQHHFMVFERPAA